MSKLWVVIPFYQKAPGILARAVASIAAQTRQVAGIVVVDDASPVEPGPELAAFGGVPRIDIIRQSNAGPAGARNTGLDRVPPDATHVAFLDSDDAWHPDHVGAALDAMERHAADCYFGTISGGAAFDYHSDMAALALLPGLRTLQTDPTILTAEDLPARMLDDWSHLHLSAMVLARPLFQELRFDAELRLAAEDVLFFHDALRRSARAILSTAPAAARGEGANIFHGVDNRAPQYLRQQFITLRALERLALRPGVDASGQATLERRKERARREAIWGQAVRLRMGKAPQWGELGRWARHDPAFVRSLAGIGLGRLRRRQPTGQPSDNVRKS